MKLDFAPQVEAELRIIADWIARDNATRAETFVLELHDVCRKLLDLPYGYPVDRIVNGQEIRRKVHGNYLVFYAVDDRRLLVLSVRHGARRRNDLRNRLRQD